MPYHALPHHTTPHHSTPQHTTAHHTMPQTTEEARPFRPLLHLRAAPIKPLAKGQPRNFFGHKLTNWPIAEKVDVEKKMCLKMPASNHIVPQVTRSTHIAITQTLHCVDHSVEHRSSLASWKTKLLDLQNKAQWQVPKTKEPWRVRERKPPIGPVSHGKNPNQLESSVCPRYLCACAVSMISACICCVPMTRVPG